MKKAIALLLFIVIVASACTIVEKNEYGKAIDKGLKYLDQAWTGGSYNDQYLLYIYPGEDIRCPVAGCRLTYRILDAYFNLKLIKDEFSDYAPVNEHVEYADRVMNAIQPLWETENMSNTISKADPDGIALDTYCILGYEYANPRMADRVIFYIAGQKWIYEDYYIIDPWRNIADETWCVRLINRAKPDFDPSFMDTLVTVKLLETENFLKANYTDTEKAAVLAHMIPMLYERDREKYSEQIRTYQDEFVRLIDREETLENTLLLANALETLAKSGYHDREKMKWMADQLLSRQELGGQWYINDQTMENNLQVFTTFRAVIALNAYNKVAA